MDEKYSFLGDADGNLIPAKELALKLGDAQNLFNTVSDPTDAHEVIRGMTAADVREIFERCKINDRSTMRIFGASPLWVPRHIVTASAVAIAETASEEHPIPPDIEVMVRGHAHETMIRKRFSTLEAAMYEMQEGDSDDLCL